MVISADSIRVVHPLFYQMEGGGSLPTSALQLNIEEINRYKAKELNTLWHSRLPIYDTGFCLNSIVSYGAIFDGLYYAIAIWTNPVAPQLPQHEWLELRRMAISDDAPKNTASRMLAVMALLIKRKFPIIERLISYQDVEAHRGTIYKAAGWEIGNNHNGGSWNRPNSKNTYNRKPRIRLDINNAIGPKIRWDKIINGER